MGSTCSTSTSTDDVVPTMEAAPFENANKYKPTVICGPSGVGKGTLLKALRAQYPKDITVAVSHTTRNPREGEEDGIHYHFVTKQQFESDIEDGKFIEHAGNYGNIYGTSKQAIKDVTDAQKICLLEIDVVGAQRIKQSGMEANFLFITVKGEDQSCKERITSRGTENEDQIEKRVQTCKKEFLFFKENAQFFDASISNDNLEESTQEIIALFNKWYEWLPAANTNTL